MSKAGAAQGWHSHAGWHELTVPNPTSVFFLDLWQVTAIVQPALLPLFSTCTGEFITYKLDKTLIIEQLLGGKI